MKLRNFSQGIIGLSFHFLFFLVPLIFTPWNYELFEFNKMTLTYFLTIIVMSAWLLKMISEKKFIFRKSILDIPLILFFISQLISTFLSIDRHTSFWGYYGRFNGGLLSIFCYLLLYWAFISNMDREKTLLVLRYTLYASVIVVLYGIAEHFGIDAKYWVQDVKNRVFSTLGQPNWLAAWIVALLPIIMAIAINHSKTEISLLIFKKQKLKTKKIRELTIYYFLLFIFYLCLLYTKSRSGFLGFVAAYLAFWGLFFLYFSSSKLMQKVAIASSSIKKFIIISGGLFFITLFVGSPFTPDIKDILRKTILPPSSPVDSQTTPPQSLPPPLITESGDIRKIVWKGAIEIWKHYPIFGTGVETFAYSYYWYRPREHNDISEWDFLYNKAHNEYLTILANTGLVGLITYLGIIFTFVGWSLYTIKKGDLKLFTSDNYSEIFLLHLAFLAGYISILVTNFFGFSVVPVNLLFFLFPAINMALIKTKKEEAKKEFHLNKWQKTGICLILLFSFWFLIYILKFWYADTRFALGEKLNNSGWYEKAYQALQTAIKLHSSEPYYHQEMAYSLAGMSTLTEEATISSQLADLAIFESDKALKISPYHLNFWKKRAKMLILLSSIDSKYQLYALDALLEATKLAPTDAKIFYNLGLLYSNLNQKEEAIKILQQTIELKPNYAQARYALALLYEKDGKIKEAKEQLEYILKNIDPTDVRAKEKLEKL